MNGGYTDEDEYWTCEEICEAGCEIEGEHNDLCAAMCEERDESCEGDSCWR